MNEIAITATSRLGKPPQHNAPDNRPITVEFDDTYTKSAVFRALIRKKPRSIYANEFLTHTRRRMFNLLKDLQRSNPSKIRKFFSRDGIINVQTENADQPIKIHGQRDLERCISDLR